MMNKNEDKPSQIPDAELTDEGDPSLDEAGKPVEIISLDLDSGEEGEETPGLDEETTLELLRQAQNEAYREEVAEYTDDEAVQDSFEARQALDAGSRKLAERLEEYHAKSPKLSAGDLDAGWDKANVGDETAGGTAATPDQDRVGEYGEAYGITYEDDEPLHTEEKLAERDKHRWELDPESDEQG